MAAPRTIDELKAVADPGARITAAALYIENGEAKIREARHIRDTAIRALAEAHGPAEAARLAGVSLSTVKLVRGRP
jgi:hypothetical protein